MQQVFPALYARAKNGALRVWTIEVRTDSSLHPAKAPAQIVIDHGVFNGKMTQATETIKWGKNRGKSNETTPYMQACYEAESRWKKKKDSGYTETPPPEGVRLNGLGLPMPMLALPFNKYNKELPERVYIQPKLNGHRCLAGWVDGKIRLWSRKGKWVETMGHVVEALSHCLPKDLVLDGELYIHGNRLQDIGSYIKRYQPGFSERVTYHIYDAVLPEPFGLRSQRIYHEIHHPSSAINRVFTVEIDPINLMEQHAVYLDLGYEGTMVRLPIGAYEAGYRSQSLLKVKQFQDGEWVVRDITKGTPKVVDGRTYNIAILHCDDFTVTAPGTVIEKDAIYRRKEHFIGKPVTVQYAELTKEGRPFHPTALQFREDI